MTYFNTTKQKKTQKFSLPVWILLCSARFPFCEKHFKHTSHWYGFWPLCHLMCKVSDVLWAKDWGHCVQLYFFSPVCTGRWFKRFARVLNAALHMLHVCGRSSECTSWWRCNSCLCLKLLLHLLQTKRRPLLCSASL